MSDDLEKRLLALIGSDLFAPGRNVIEALREAARIGAEIENDRCTRIATDAVVWETAQKRPSAALRHVRDKIRGGES